MALEQKRISRQTQANKQPPLLATPRGKSPSSPLTNVSTGKKGQRPPQPRFNESILAGHQRSKLFTPQQSRAALQQSMMAQGSSLNPNPNPNLKLEGVPQLSLNDTTTKGNNVSSSAMYQQHQSLSGGERSILAAQAFLSADAQRQQQKLAQQQAQGIVMASDSSKFLTDKDMREVTPALRSSEISFPSQQQLHHAIAQQQQKRQQKLGQKRLDAFDDMGYPLGMQYKEMEFHGITRGLQARIANVPIHPLFTEKEMQELSILPNALPFPPGPMRAADGQGSSLPAHFVKLQFVAMELFAPRKQPQLPGIPPWAPPQRFLFSFKFYKMPRTISRIVALSGEQRDSSQGQGAFVLPSSGVLCEIKYDGSVDGSGGYSVSLAVDHTHYGDDRAAILDYFANNPLVIDVVDADSLLPVGKAVVSLASLLRGDYRGVQNNATVDVVSPGQEGPGQHQRTGTFSDRRQEPFARPHPGAIVVGRLCMRLSSVGIPLVPSTHPTRSKQPNQHQAIISLGSASASAGGRLLNPVTSTANPSTSAKTFVPKLVDNYGTVLSQQNTGTVAPDADTMRKKAQLQSIKKALNVQNRESNGTIHSITARNTTPSGLENNLSALSELREKTKREMIQKHLEASLVQAVNVQVSYGEKAYFEYRLANPNHASPLTVRITTSSPHISIVTDIREWKALVNAYGCTTVPEDDMFMHTKEGVLVMLHPLEDVIIPFKYMLPPHAVADPVSHQSPFSPSGTRAGKSNARGRARSGLLYPLQEEVAFEAVETKQPIGRVSLTIHPQSPVVDDEVDLYAEQQAVFRHRLRIPSTLRNVCGLMSSGDVSLFLEGTDEVQDVAIKCDCGISPSVTSFFVVFYTDDGLFIKPASVWKINIHAVETYRMRSFLGEVSHALLTFRAHEPAQHTRAFSSDRQQLHIEPNREFPVIGHAVTEVGISVHTTAVGESKHVVNIVDLDGYRVIHTFQVIVTTELPPISKAFELLLSSSSEYVNKKIGYINRYKQPLHLTFYTTSPDRIAFKHRSMVLQPGEKKGIGFRVFRSDVRLEEDVLLLAVNQNKHIEDAFQLTLTQQQQPQQMSTTDA